MSRKSELYREYDEVTGELTRKECSKCHEIKDVSCFGKNKKAKDGVQCQCKQCANKYNRQWNENHKEERCEYNRQWRENNPDYGRQYNEDHKEEISEYKRQYYENNKEKDNERSRQYHENNKEKDNERSRQWRENNPDYQRQRYEKEVQQEIDKIHENVTKKRYPNNGIQYGIIYGVQNLITNRWYIGQTETSFNIRYHGDFFKYKIDGLSKDNVRRQLLVDDIEKYGQENFEIFEVIDVAFSEKELDEKEAYYIDLYKAYDEGYNSTRGNIFKHGKEKRMCCCE